ncbi:MAG: sigma-70 family RNA polymerase sigma factor [Actinobacteria bacterium]|nr:sigma-70 family RNA polymerase sigma factor [Actinomycetota bacterium]
MQRVRTNSGGGEDELVRLYLADVGRHPLLTRAEETQLAQEILAGREASQALENPRRALSDDERRHLESVVAQADIATEHFVRANLRLVVSIAKRYTSSGLSLLDLVQEGNVGLMHAVDRFDVRRGFRFSTYATWWIRQAVSRAIANTGRAIRLPVQAGDLVSKVRRAQAHLEAETGRAPTVEEVAKDVSVSPAKVRQVLAMPLEMLSMSEPQAADSDSELGDSIADHEAASPFDVVAASMLPAQIRTLLDALSERERRVVYLRYGLDRGRARTLDEVGHLFSLSREQIRQIERRALMKLRERSERTGARELLVG